MECGSGDELQTSTPAPKCYAIAAACTAQQGGQQTCSLTTKVCRLSTAVAAQSIQKQLKPLGALLAGAQSCQMHAACTSTAVHLLDVLLLVGLLLPIAVESVRLPPDQTGHITHR